MKEKEIRAQLDEVRGALKKNEDEHDVLVSLIKGYEGWLRLNGQSQLPLSDDVIKTNERPKNGSKPKGTTSFRQSVLKTLRDAHGEPLHVKEILRRTKELGAVTTAKDPHAITDLQCYALMKGGEPIKKVSGRTWAWQNGN